MPDYNWLERQLHRIALSDPAVLRAAERIDATLASALRLTLPAEASPVFVCGLARSGTTLVLELLAASGHFASLTYRNMPFVTAPFLWPRMASRFTRPIAERERAHGDGVLVDGDSAEAFEEVFWRALLNDEQYRDTGLYGEQKRPADAAASFRNFVMRVAAAASDTQRPLRYLSKNNCNLVRLELIATCFPEAAILVVLRDPRGFVASSLSQHRHFSELHDRNSFARAYMRWLGHHEFGLDFRPLAFEGVAPPAGGATGVDGDYLLRYWITVHRALARNTAIRVVSYDDLVEKPGLSVRAIEAAVGLEPGTVDDGVVRHSSSSPKSVKCSRSLLADARSLHATLRTAAINVPS